MTPGRPLWRSAVFNAASTASDPELQRIVLPVPIPHRSNVIRLNCSHSSAFTASRMNIAHRVQKLSGLGFQRCANRPRPVTKPGHSERRCKVQVTVAVDIPNVHPVGPLPENREILGKPRHLPRFEARKLLGQGPRTRTRNRRDNLRQHAIRFAGYYPTELRRDKEKNSWLMW